MNRVKGYLSSIQSLSFGYPINSGLDIKPEMHHIAVLYHIFFSFNS